ncbi:hypothetical protein LFM09_17860 [Lentzea alba]|uniref:hypothetical protein n=1 Tax=Lentzea alba TaxID=2714351 RepID=UPI0039BEFD59
MPRIVACAVLDAPADEVCVAPRLLRLRLVAHDDADRGNRYVAEDTADPSVRDQVSGVRVPPASESMSPVEWRADLDRDMTDEPQVISQVRDGIFLPCLTALKERFA